MISSSFSVGCVIAIFTVIVSTTLIFCASRIWSWSANINPVYIGIMELFFLSFFLFFISLSLSHTYALSLSLSLSHTHTHTHTHVCSLALSVSLTHTRTAHAEQLAVRIVRLRLLWHTVPRYWASCCWGWVPWVEMDADWFRFTDTDCVPEMLFGEVLQLRLG